MKHRNSKTIKILIAVIIIALTLVDAVTISNTAFEKKAFIAGGTDKIATYTVDKKGELEKSGTVSRGREIISSGRSREDGKGNTYISVESGDSSFYVNEKNLVPDKSDIVQEKTSYVRTPATIYAKADGPEIAGFAPKGTCLEIKGYDFVKRNGQVNKYRIKTDAAAGYVYGRYMAATQEEADAPYNEHGEYDKAKTQKYGMELYGGSAENLDFYPHEKINIKGNPFCSEARTMYLNCYAAVHNEEYYDLARESGCNAVVIDIKDGCLAYDSEVAKELSPTSYKNSYVSMEEYAKAVKKFNDAGIYTIGRIVCFNDPQYAKDHPEACIKSAASGSSWLSAFSRSAWYYNVSLAIEAVDRMGFNEIQFDYVRFPEAAYDMSIAEGTDFRNSYGEEKAQAIQNFCFYASDQIHEAGAYFSVDVFGECSNGYVTAYGQYWPAISNVVDAISSMPYTDHFGSADTWSEPAGVMSSWAKGAAKGQEMIPTPAAARTWITGYDTPHWNPVIDYDENKLRQQIDVLYKAGLNGGFIPWNGGSSIGKYREYREIWSYEKQ